MVFAMRAICWKGASGLRHASTLSRGGEGVCVVLGELAQSGSVLAASAVCCESKASIVAMRRLFSARFLCIAASENG